jgi:hypothetical protein
VDPGVGVDPLDLHDLAFEQDRAVRIEFASEGVMGRQLHGEGQRERRSSQC